MFQRCVCYLLIVAYIAGQLAAMPHTHGAESASSQPEHGRRPHVHLSLAKHVASSHDHHHGHSHPHPAKGSSPTSQTPQPVESSLPDHDADAVYIANTAILRTAGEAGSKVVSDASPLAQPGVFLLTFGADFRHRAENWHPPDCQFAGCDLILALRTLRI